MPFVQRTVEPKYLSRIQLFNENGTPKITDDELEAVTNSTLCNALKQLSCLALLAEDIFNDLGDQLKNINLRCEEVKNKLTVVEDKVNQYDPKKIPVPVGDICSFAQTKEHYASKHPLETNLFSAETRPRALRVLYEAASKTPVPAMRQLDRWRKDGNRSSKFFVCTPVLGAKRRRIRGRVDIDIETRMPEVVGRLRRWTSDEALGDLTVGPDCTSKIVSTTFTDGDATDGTIGSDDEGVDHKLPSPEEQLQIIALRFPAEVVAVDISGRSFDRMSMQRRSLMTGEVVTKITDNEAVKKRGRTRRPRNRRRNTLAGTDQKEIEDVLCAGDSQTSPEPSAASSHHKNKQTTVPRSKSSDVLRPSSIHYHHRKDILSDTKISRFNSLKQWGKNQYDKFLNKSNGDKSENTSPNISTNNSKSKIPSEDGIDDFNLYETVTMKRRRDINKERKTHERHSSISSSEKSLPVSTLSGTTSGGGALSSVMNIAVKLRDSSLQRRQRRNGTNKDEPNSSSGNWSASSESGRASIGSEITSTTHPKSTTSVTTSNNSLHPPSSVNSRRRFNINTSNSSSVTSEGSTLTPDIIHDLHEDGDSVYSCDTEGYYTSFHMDSGLKTLKEEDTPSTPLQSTSAFSDSNNTVLSAENEYESFGKGSTSTTTSSAGTVCTTLRASESHRSLVIGPAVPERKSSLSNKSIEATNNNNDKTGTVKRSPALNNSKPTVVALIHKNDVKIIQKKTNGGDNNGGDISPDSGHNTSSSPIEESASSPNGVRSGSDFEFSESSDMEGTDRIERIRVKTTINSSRIPSMCAITPQHSDDETSSNSSYRKQTEIKNMKNKHELENNNDKMKNDQIDGQRNHYFASESINESNNKSMIKSSLQPLNNMLGKLKTNLSNITGKRDRSKSPASNNKHVEEELLDALGEYVTLADVRNNNEKFPTENHTYSNDLINDNLNTVLTGKIRDTEYVSLNELPPINENNNVVSSGSDSSLERKKRQGARVLLDAEGKVIYSSDSLRRRKPPTTFEPGPFIKLSSQQSPCPSPQVYHRTPVNVRPVVSKQEQMKLNVSQIEFHRPMSPVSGNKVIIKASGNHSEIIRTPSTVVQPASPKSRPLSPKGAYVHVQATGVPLSPKQNREGVQSPSSSTNSIVGAGVIQNPHQEEMFNVAKKDIYGSYYTGQMHNNPPYYHERGNCYSTLPSKKTQYFDYDGLPERSITPDITRGLDRNTGPLTSYSKFDAYHADQNLLNLGHTIGIPINDHQLSNSNKNRSGEEDSFKISPIDPTRNAGGFKSSTPCQMKSSGGAAENLDFKLLSPKRSTMSNEELYAVIHKSKKKLNIDDDLNVNKSSSSVVKIPPSIESHQTSTPKRTVVETGYIGARQNVGSPSKGEYVYFNSDIDKFSPINEQKNRQSSACSDRKGVKKTSTLDFKKLLLQKSSSLSCNKKISAVEQLQLSKQQMEQRKEQQTVHKNLESNNTGSNNMTILDLTSSPRNLINRRHLINNSSSSPERTASSSSKQIPKILSPKSQWRFASPRSNVMSSTILEDCREDDTSSNASKNSLEKRNLEISKESSKLNEAEKETDIKQSSIENNSLVNSSSKKSIDFNSSSSSSSSTNPHHIQKQSNSTKYATLSERLSAQRAEFFATTPTLPETNNNNNNNDKIVKLPPTLETSF